MRFRVREFFVYKSALSHAAHGPHFLTPWGGVYKRFRREVTNLTQYLLHTEHRGFILSIDQLMVSMYCLNVCHTTVPCASPAAGYLLAAFGRCGDELQSARRRGGKTDVSEVVEALEGTRTQLVSFSATSLMEVTRVWPNSYCSVIALRSRSVDGGIGDGLACVSASGPPDHVC